MSQENVEAFLEGAEALNRGDMDSALEGAPRTLSSNPKSPRWRVHFNGRDGVSNFRTSAAFEGSRL